jgi:ATP-binding cassette subfamily C protein
VTLDTDRVSTSAYHLLTLITGVAVAAVYFGVALRLSVPMTLLAGGFGVVLLWTMRGRTSHAAGSADAYAGASRALFGMASESLSGLKVARIVGAEDRSIDHFAVLTRRTSAAYLDMLRAFAQSKVRLDIAAAVLVSGLLLVAVEVFGLHGAGLLLLVFVFARIVPRMMSLQESAQLVAAGLPSFAAVLAVVDECERHPEQIGDPRAAVSMHTELRLDRVSYRYADDSPLVLDCVTVSVRAGLTTALVGRSGSGKSTVADLMMGLIRPAAGGVSVDGRPLDDASLRAWRKSVGYVPQDSFLLHDTIRANLRWACPDASDEDMWRALDLAAARDFVAVHPEGLDLVVGDRGIRLSGGERQRLALARALLGRPDVLILDEATSALDSINEHDILSTVARLHGQLTIVLITHRLSTIRSADLVYVLESGRVVESGRWTDLAARPDGAFRRLLEAQHGHVTLSPASPVELETSA